jgi:hypothetical protein
MGEMRNTYNIFVGKPEGKRPFRNLGLDRRIIGLLKCILGKQVWRMWIGLIWPRKRTGGEIL